MIELISKEPSLISDLLIKNGIQFHMPCGGRGTCHKCKVKIFGDVMPASGNELSLLSEDELQNGVRFACMAYIKGKAYAEITGNHTSEKNTYKIVTQGLMPEISLQPWSGLEYGISVDIGTTTVALYLYDLRTGKNVDAVSDINSQVKYGADVISRIEKSINGSRKDLSKTIVDCINVSIEKLTTKNNIKKDGIGALAITGNTAMMYLLCGYDPIGIAKMPFKQDRYFGEFLKQKDLGINFPEINVPENCGIYLTRSISSYVGGDITSAIIASELYKNEGSAGKGGSAGNERSAGMENINKLLVDIGTNGEMVISHDGKLICCSTAAGPVFEGAGIYNGMPAKDGAIYKVTAEDGNIVPNVIGNIKAQGICGSGLIDAVAVMLDLDIIDETGYFCNGEEFFIFPETDIKITQKDIRQVQLAKSAICSGMYTLIERAGLRPEDVDELYVAGGFGNNINILSAERIGLIPKGFSGKAKFIGNAAGTGVSMMMLDHSLLLLSEEISKKAETVELSTDKFFMEKYIEGMYF